MKLVYLSLGSNLGDREAMLRDAIRRLHSRDFTVRRVSSVFETAPMYIRDQPSFLNLVLEAETTLFPMRLLTRIESIQKEMGRKRIVNKGPRVIDIDILLFGSFRVQTHNLEIPHPRMSERRFVLEPLAELVPDLRHPVTRQPIRELLAATAGQRVHKTGLQIEVPQLTS
jgi:2-amino-4-hydroxy-6-hydroxymethyldihydropteridine diphosphokinase